MPTPDSAEHVPPSRVTRWLSGRHQTRDAEVARIARWFRDTEHGPVFYDPDGQALPVSQSRSDHWKTQAIRDLDRHLAWQNRSPWAVLLIAMALIAILLVGAAMAGDRLPILRQIPPPLAALPACLWPLALHVGFRRRQSAWRRAIAAGLVLHAPLSEGEAAPHRRHNLFVWARNLVSLSVMVIGGVSAFRDPTDLSPLPLLIGLTAVAWVIHWAAMRVDATHRRRRWLV
jgi:hypothetical protein